MPIALPARNSLSAVGWNMRPKEIEGLLLPPGKAYTLLAAQESGFKEICII